MRSVRSANRFFGVWGAALALVAALAPWTFASEVRDGLEKLDAIVREAGGTEGFLGESPQAHALRERYYQQWVAMYPQGESQFPRPNFDAVIAQARKAVQDHPELGVRLFETTGLGRTFQVELDAESSGLELKQDEWKKFFQGWREQLQSRSARIRRLDEKGRQSEMQKLSAELDSELKNERARIEAMPKSARLERGRAEAELQKRLLADLRTQELASFAVHETVFGPEGEALRDILNSGDADQVLIGMRQMQRKGVLPVPDTLHSLVVKNAVPALDQPRLELDASGRAAETNLFRVKLRKTNRGKLIPEGRVAKTTLEFQTIPRRIHGLFKGVAIQECVGGGSCEHLSPERWGTIALQDSQLHLVVENGSLTPGFTHGVPVKVGDETFLSMDIQAPALNKAGFKNHDGTVAKIAAYPLWLREQHRQLPPIYRKMLVGSSTAMSNGGNRPTVASSPSTFFGRSPKAPDEAVILDSTIREVLLAQSGEQKAWGYGGNLVTETTVQKAGALTQVLPSLEGLSESQILAILERGRPELRSRILKSGGLEILKLKYPGLKSSSAFWKLLEWGCHGEKDVRRAAAEALSQESGPEALMLKARMLEQTDRDVRWRVAKSLSKESGPMALQLKAAGLEHADLEVRREVARALSSESGPEALRLRARALDDPDLYVRTAVAESLSKASGLDALALKAKALRDSDSSVRWWAVSALSNESGPEALSLKARALEDSDSRVRWNAAQSLSNESGPEALRLQAIALADPDSSVRKVASKLRLEGRPAGFQGACQRQFGALP